MTCTFCLRSGNAVTVDRLETGILLFRTDSMHTVVVVVVVVVVAAVAAIVVYSRTSTVV